jgi:serine/threonine protein kinase
MKSLAGFPFVLDLHYCFQSANYLYLIIDYCPNGDFTKLESMNNVKLFFAEVLLAFEYIHNKGVIYRDLKPENILLDETGHAKLCDFNLAKSGMSKTKRANSFCGSPLYFSPEMVMEKGATYKSDIYGIGLLMYEMFTGNMAYHAKTIKELYDKIKKNQINFNDPKLQGDAKDLVMRMLAKNPEDRIDIEDAKKHKYFNDIDFDKVLNKEYGNIVTVKKVKDKKKEKRKKLEEANAKNKEDIEYKKFMEQQKALDEDKNLTVATGKITLKEMKLDQLKPMKNKVRGFYFVKKEDIGQTQEFQLEINGKVEGNEDNVDISSLIIDQYEA